MYPAQGRNAVTPVSLEPATLRPQVYHSEPLHAHGRLIRLDGYPQEETVSL